MTDFQISLVPATMVGLVVVIGNVLLFFRK